jgi:hypothetical protein
MSCNGLKRVALVLVLTTGVVSLTACLAVNNLAVRGNGLPHHWADMAQTMTHQAQKHCVKTTGYDGLPKREWRVGRRLDNEWQGLRFFVSDTAWFRAQTLTEGFIDDIYFNQHTRQFVCGEHSWTLMDESRSVRFKEITVERP